MQIKKATIDELTKACDKADCSACIIADRLYEYNETICPLDIIKQCEIGELELFAGLSLLPPTEGVEGDEDEMNKFIGITENKLHHILGVARECYLIAKKENRDEYFCRKMFIIGWNHDVGYEFSQTNAEHPDVSCELVSSLFSDSSRNPQVINSATLAIKKHGRRGGISQKSDEWRILNTADMTINSKGEKVTAEERLEEIRKRYGLNSEEYIVSHDICVGLGLVN